MRRNPHLLVPIRDRRQRRRILTLKNFGIALGAFILLFVLLSFDFFRRGAAPGDYGRLFGKQVGTDVQPLPAQPQIVTEAPVPDQTVADPLLVAPAAREQILGTPPPQTATAPAANYAALGTPVPQQVQAGSAKGVSIVGGAGGVAIVRGADTTPRPVLGGGVFKQP